MDKIAIIGIGCRFPGANNPEEFWRLLCNGVDAISEVPESRWNINALYDPTPGARGKMSTRWGGFLDQVDQFDPQFFGIAPREAVCIDPQQRLLLEVAWEALERAGQVPERLARDSVGVFMGISTSDYHQILPRDVNTINAYMGTGNAFSIAANRLSYLFDFRGPSLAVDTACSSSLVAAHLACQSLRSGESNLALAGGVNLILSPELTIIFSDARMMAADGRCKTFDARADGYVRGEGCGVVVLKRLSDALRDHDPILAVIQGSAVNQDGRSNGLTAPNGPSQEAVILRAMAQAGVKPADMDYVELHGTGTALGDPIEAEALGNVLSNGVSRSADCAVGSVKTNIGHLEAAAGVAGLIKAALSLHHRKIPPSLHFQQPNPYIPLDRLPIKVQQTLDAWPEISKPALAGVSSFGFGGTNAHVILTEAPQANPVASVENTLDQPYLLPLSARSPEALSALARKYREFLMSATAGCLPQLEDVCYTASVHRGHHEHRLALTFFTRDQLLEQLAAAARGEACWGLSIGCKQRNHRSKLVFVFSGQGPQWWGMGRELSQHAPIFRAKLEDCDRCLSKYADWSLLDELQADEAHSKLGETQIAQPALFALQVALAAFWDAWGVKPDAVIGHSIGEVAAAHVAGALSLEDAVRVVFHRGRVMQRGVGLGKMAAVGISAEAAMALLAQYEGRLAIAAINSPNSIVLSGEAAALEAVLSSLQEQDVFCKFLRVDYAFHSPQMAPFQAELVESLQGLQPQSTTIPMVSTITGERLQGQELDAIYWGRTMREQVRFSTAVEAMIKRKHRLFVELGPHPVLAANISQCLRRQDQTGLVCSSLRRQEPERTTLLNSLGALYTQGFPVDWRRLYPSGNQILLPTYPWQRRRFWLGNASGWQLESQLAATANPDSTAIDNINHSDGVSLATPPKAEWTLTRADLLAVAPEKRQSLLESHFSHLLANVMGFSAAKLDLQQPLFSLGLDSLMAVELKDRIEAILEITVPLDSFYNLSVAQFVQQLQLLVEGKDPTEQLLLSPESSPGDDQPMLDRNWFVCPKPLPQAQTRLFCFPYAGAGASIFRNWADKLPPEIELCAIQLPGREARLKEEPINRLSCLVQTLTPLLFPYFDKPFAFFGHSLGALIAFEVIRELRRHSQPEPNYLFVSGGRAPQLPDLERPIHRLPEPQFIEELRRLHGFPAEILENPELMQLLSPTLRADFALLETYFYTTGEPLNCQMMAFGGLQDNRISQEALAAWRDQTTREFTLQQFDGGHFFLHSHRDALLTMIIQAIQPPIPAIPHV